MSTTWGKFSSTFPNTKTAIEADGTISGHKFYITTTDGLEWTIEEGEKENYYWNKQNFKDVYNWAQNWNSTWPSINTRITNAQSAADTAQGTANTAVKDAAKVAKNLTQEQIWREGAVNNVWDNTTYGLYHLTDRCNTFAASIQTLKDELDNLTRRVNGYHPK